MITRAKISAVRANSFVVLEQFIAFFLVIRNSSNKRRIGGAALIRGRRLVTFMSHMRRLFEGGAYSRAAVIRVNTVRLKSKTSRKICHASRVDVNGSTGS